jgi:hypothetical protein
MTHPGESEPLFAGSVQEWDQALQRFIERDEADETAESASEFLATLDALLAEREQRLSEEEVEEVTVKAYVQEGHLILRRPAPLPIESNALRVGQQRIRIELEEAA